jgi:microcystin-dependent protein
MAGLIPLPRSLFFDASGQPVGAGYNLYTYAAGTTTPKATYTDQSGVTPNTNPFPLTGNDSIWFNGAYKIDLKDSLGVSVAGYPVDNVIFYNPVDWSTLTATIPELNATDTSTLSKTTTYTVGLTDRGKTILADATSGAFTINLLDATTATNGFEITIKKTDVNKAIITITPANSQTIDGRVSFILYDQNDVVKLISDGNNWRIKSGLIRGNTELLSTAYTTTIADNKKTFICSATSSYNVTLLSSAIVGDGFKNTFKKSTDSNLITLVPAGSETIDGASSYILKDPYDAVTIISDGTNWLVINVVGTSTTETGELRYTIDTTPKVGEIPYNGGTIGNASSNATTRKNADTQALFTKFWNNVANTFAPIFNSDGTVGTRGADATTDFNANKAIKMPGCAGQTIGIAGTGTLGFVFTIDTGTDALTVSTTNNIYTGTPVTVSTTGTLPAPLAANTTYYAILESGTTFKLASTVGGAVDGTAVDITTSGAGVQTVTITYPTYALGQSVGETTHSVTVNEMPSHDHDTQLASDAGGNAYSAPGGDFLSDVATSFTGGSLPHNNMQPTQFLNVYIKL